VKPNHHVEEAELAAYAAGTLREGLEVLVACHLTFCPACRDTVARLETAAAALWLEQDGPAMPVASTVSLEQLLAAAAQPLAPSAPKVPVAADERLPAPLRNRVGPYQGLHFRRYPLDVGHRPLPELGEGAFLLDLPPELALPGHVHEGVERALVLSGGFASDGQAYGPGDVSNETGEGVHEVLVDPGERCLCLFVNDGPILPEQGWLRPFARLLQ